VAGWLAGCLWEGGWLGERAASKPHIKTPALINPSAQSTTRAPAHQVMQRAICPERGQSDALTAIASVTHVYVANDLQVTLVRFCLSL